MNIKTKMAKVPKEWWNNKKKLARQLKIRTPQAIILSDKIMAEAIVKGKRKKKIEVYFK